MTTRLSVLFQNMLQPHVLLVGILFFLVNAHYEYVLYHVNTYKIFMIGLCAILLYLFHDLLTNKASARNKETQASRVASWQVVALLSLPVLATMPGYLLKNGVNYNFSYELMTDIFLFIWAMYLFRSVQTSDKQLAFFGWVVAFMVFITGYAVLEFFGLNPLVGNGVPTRPKATFGNINYFAGFLATLTPMFLILALPRVVSSGTQYSLGYDRIRLFFLIGFLGFVLSALLAQSRAALGATTVASIIALSLWAYVFLKDRHRLYVIIGVSLAVVLAVAVTITAFLVPDLREVLIPGRFANLFHENAWQGRTSPLIAAAFAFIESPIFGWGLGAAYNVNFLFMPADTELYLGNRSYNHVHNEFLEMSEEGGLLLLLVWLSLMLYIFWKLFAIARNRDNQSTDRIIAIGCICGILAFYGHGVFSVAQRMVVANLPLYSLFSIAFVQIYRHRTGSLLFAMPEFLRKLPSKVWQLVPSTLLLAFGWLLFVPFIASFYSMIKIGPQMNKIEGVIKMEEHMKAWPNPYGLDDLMSRQIQFRRYDEMLATADMVKKIIPEYRSLGYKESVAYYYTNRIEDAKQRALAYQERVGYDQNNISLLGAIAIRTQDEPLLIAEIERLLQLAIIRRSPFDSFNNKPDVTFVIDDNATDMNLVVEEDTPEVLQLQWSPQLLQDAKTAMAGNANSKKIFIERLARTISSLPIMRPPVRETSQQTEALELIQFEQQFTQLLQEEIKKKRNAYIRSVRPKQNSRSDLLKAQRNIAQLENDVRKRFEEKRRDNKKRLAEILTVNNVEDYLTLAKGMNDFIANLAKMANLVSVS